MKNIPHLHVHSYYSILDGVSSPEAYLKRCDELQIPAIAMTDHGNVGSWAQFSIESKNYKTKPILGLEAYVTDNTEKVSFVRKKLEEEKNAEKKKKYSEWLKKHRSASHVVLLAKEKKGYDNIISINNHSWTDGFYYSNRTDFNHLKKHSDGVICLSACQSGIVSKLLLSGQKKKAVRVARFMKQVYGGNFYLELQFLDMPVQDKLNKLLVSLGKAHDIPFVITNDVHYLKKGDHKLQQVLIDMITRKKEGEEGFKIECEVNYLKTLKDFERDFREHKSVPKEIFHQALDNVCKIADECNCLVETGNLYFPTYNHKDHFLYSKFPIKDKNEFFKKILLHRSKIILGKKVKDKIYKERLVYEFKILRKLKGIDYFLIVDDLLNYVRKNKAFSVIRGSANGSLIAFIFEFGLIDPIKHSIMFERFISEYRSLNDVDIDIDVRSEFRSKAVSYLKEKYGLQKVLTVGTYNRMQLKGAIKDVTRVFRERIDDKVKATKSEKKAERLYKRQEQYLFHIVNKITSVMEGDLDIKTARKNHQGFNAWYESNKKMVSRYIEPIVGNVKNISLHPAGVIILPDGHENLLPIRTQKNPHGKGRVVATVWENSHTGREDLNEIGVMALDILGVKTLSVVSEVIELVKKKKGIEIDLRKMDLEDKKTLEMFNKGETLGVFQFSGGAANQIVKATKITEFNDLIVINALARPGALQAGADKLYAERKDDSNLIRYDHHSLRNVLNDSSGVLVFSEHILRTAIEFAGMDPKKADDLRKIIKGKNLNLFKEYKKKFIGGAIDKWKSEKRIETIAEGIWKKFSKAGSYLFPRGHASSYALIGYICMYLKVHYPIEFFACHLRYAVREKYAEIKGVAENFYGIKFIMPNINKAKSQFEPSKTKIWWPVSALKNVGDKASESIVRQAPFVSIEDFFNRVDKRVCNKRVVERLIVAGAFKNFANTRAAINEYYNIRCKGNKKKMEKLPLAFGSKEDMALAKEDVFGFEFDSLQQLYKDKLAKFSKLTSYNEFKSASSQKQIIAFGKVSKLYKTVTKNGDEMAFSALKDGRDIFNITLFPEAYGLAKEYFKMGNVLVVSGAKNTWNKEISVVLQTSKGTKYLGFKSGSWVKKL